MATVVAFSEFLFPKGTTGLLFVPGWDQGSLQDFSHPHPPHPNPLHVVNLLEQFVATHYGS